MYNVIKEDEREDGIMTSEAKKKANARWNAANYEQVKISVPKGTREEWKKAAETAGISLAAYIRAAVEEKIQS